MSQNKLDTDVSGVGGFATQAQAEAESINTAAMTPGRVGEWSDYNAGIVGDLQALTVAGFSAADALLAWDDSAAVAVGMTLSTGLTFAGTVLTLDAQLQDISALAVTDSNIIVGDGANWVAESGATARTSLGVAIGTNVQAWDADLDAIAALAKTADNFMVADGAAWQLVTPANARIALGVGTTDSPTFVGTTLGSAVLTGPSANRLEVGGRVAFIHDNAALTSAEIFYSSATEPTTEGSDGDIFLVY